MNHKGINTHDALHEFGIGVTAAAAVTFPDQIDTGIGEDPWGNPVNTDYGMADMTAVLYAGGGEGATSEVPAGITEAILTIEHSDDGMTWLPLCTAQNPSAPLGQIQIGTQLANVEVPVYHKRYLQAKATLTGATGGLVSCALQYQP